MKNEKYPYQREWENYRFREKTLSFPAILLFIFAGSSPADNYKAVAITLFLICLLLGIVSGFGLAFGNVRDAHIIFIFRFAAITYFQQNVFIVSCQNMKVQPLKVSLMT
jgi:hypothetical protein